MQNSQIYVNENFDYKESLKDARWLFIRRDTPTLNQRQNINKFLFWKGKYQNTCGVIQDYLQIMKRLSSELDENQKINLVVDLKSYKDIFHRQYKRQRYISKFNKVYIFSSNQRDKTKIIKEKKVNPLIDDNFDDFQKFIKLNPEQILQRQNRNVQEHVLRQNAQNISVNFNLMEQKLSNQIRIKIISFLKLQQKYYQKYLQKFTVVFEHFNIQSGRTSGQVVGKIFIAIQKLANGNKDEFCKIMLKLYKDEHCKFYQFININLKKLRSDIMEWDQIALPVSLLFKAIKIYFEKESNRQKINELFDTNGQCILWRTTWICEKQLLQIKNRLNHEHIFYELASFTSTSRSKAIACRFINIQNLKKNCLLKFIIKKPSFQQQIDYLNFMYLSFVIFDQQILLSENPQQISLNQQMNLAQEGEVLLNSLSSCRIEDIESFPFEELKQYKPQLQNVQYWNRDIPLIKITVMSNIFSQFSRQDWSINTQLENQINEKKEQELIEYIMKNKLQKIPRSIKQYLIVIDLIKNHQKFTIGHAKKYLREYQQALEYFQQMFSQEAQRQNLKQMYNNQMELAEIHQKMGHYKQSLQSIQKSVLLCEQMKQVSREMTERDYHILMYKMIQKSTQLLQENFLTHTALQKIEKSLRKLKKEAQKYPDKRQAKRFFYAQLLIERAIIHFRNERILEAKNDIDESKAIIDEVMKAIDYQNLKQQSFYVNYCIRFIVHLLLGQKLKVSYQQFAQLKQIQNIKQATNIIGGQNKLLKVVQNSTELSLSMDLFIQKHAENLNRQSFQNEQLYKQKLFKDTEQYFEKRQLPKENNLQSQVKQFFNDFHKKINGSSNTKMFKRLRKSIQTLILFDVKDIALEDLIKYQKKLRILKKSFINLKLKSQKQKPEQDYSYLKEQQKLDSLIQYKRQQIKKFIETHYKTGYSQYFMKNIKQMGINNSDYSALHNLTNQKYQLQLEDYLGMQSSAKNTLNKAINNFKPSTLNPKIIDLYFKKIKMQYAQAQIDFQHCQKKISQEIRQLQKNQIAQCNKALKDVEKLVISYKNKQNLVPNIQQEDERKKKQFLEEKQIEISLWNIKINLLEWHVEKQMLNKFIQKTLLQRLFQKIQRLLTSNKTKMYLSQLYETSSYLLFIKGNIKDSFKEMRKAIQTAEERIKRTYVLTKLFLLFQTQQQIETEAKYLQQLKKEYIQQKTSPLYWRICLAYHYRLGYDQQNCIALDQCIQILQDRSSYKLALLGEERKKYESYKIGYQYINRVNKGRKKPFVRAKKVNDPYFIHKCNKERNSAQVKNKLPPINNNLNFSRYK